MSDRRSIRTMIVEDSLVARELLVRLLEGDSQITVVCATASGEEALEFLERERVDVITMDINLPGIDGLETTRRIMQSCPTPIVIISGAWQPEDRALTLEALAAGAMTVLAKPAGPGCATFERSARQIVSMVKEMSGVRLVTRRDTRLSRRHDDPRAPAIPASIPHQVSGRVPRHHVRVVAIGTSTGGPGVLETILSRLPATFSLPVLIVQHIAEGFAEALATWLGQSCKLPVEVAAHGTTIQPGGIYIAPTGASLRINAQGVLTLGNVGPVGPVYPSVDVLFEAVAEAFGADAVGILLTGMGTDGVAGLARMKEKGALTIAQDEASAMIFGMPKAAIRRGAASHVLSTDQIARMIVELGAAASCAGIPDGKKGC